MSLYTKYRPRDWNSVIGQDRIKTILQSSLTHDRVGHAYLFHGSRGTGKTTSARILAKGVNCTDLRDGNPCHKCANCLAFDEGTMLDIIEIDAASNTGVDNIRELIERARFEPNQGRYKIYIIDEVHMLSTGAFNALLKTLEEPPAHVKFILATTEVEKVPETIRSRALRFDFRKITESDIIERLRFVISEERIQAEEAAIVIIAKYARGGLRDALTLLEQNTIDSELSVEHVRMTLSLLEESYIDEIIESLRTSDIHSILDTIARFRDMHVNARGFFEQMMYRLRDKIVEHLDDRFYGEYMELYRMFEDAYTRVRAIPDGILLIEITLLKIVKRDYQTKIIEKDEVKPQKTREVKNEPRKTESINTEEKEEDSVISSEVIMESRHLAQKDILEQILPSSEGQRRSEQIPRTSQGQEQGEGQKEQKSSNTPFSYITLLDRVKGTKPALVIDLKTARFDVSGKHITFIFSKNWNYSRVNTPDIRGTLSEILSTTFGGEWSVDCKLEESKVQTNIADDVF